VGGKIFSPPASYPYPPTALELLQISLPALCSVLPTRTHTNPSSSLPWPRACSLPRLSLSPWAPCSAHRVVPARFLPWRTPLRAPGRALLFQPPSVSFLTRAELLQSPAVLPTVRGHSPLLLQPAAWRPWRVPQLSLARLLPAAPARPAQTPVRARLASCAPGQGFLAPMALGFSSCRCLPSAWATPSLARIPGRALHSRAPSTLPLPPLSVDAAHGRLPAALLPHGGCLASAPCRALLCASPVPARRAGAPVTARTFFSGGRAPFQLTTALDPAQCSFARLDSPLSWPCVAGSLLDRVPCASLDRPASRVV
jgi:hypothetical protein